MSNYSTFRGCGTQADSQAHELAGKAKGSYEEAKGEVKKAMK